MQSMLFDASGGPAAGGAFAAQSPAELINRNAIRALVPGPGQFKSRCNRCATAAYDRDFYGLSSSQLTLPHNTVAARGIAAVSVAFALAMLHAFSMQERASAVSAWRLPVWCGKMFAAILLPARGKI
jgi:hypothetical protein